jgi:hypothetical protein
MKMNRKPALKRRFPAFYGDVDILIYKRNLERKIHWQRELGKETEFQRLLAELSRINEYIRAYVSYMIEEAGNPQQTNLVKICRSAMRRVEFRRWERNDDQLHAGGRIAPEHGDIISRDRLRVYSSASAKLKSYDRDSVFAAIGTYKQRAA